MDNNTSLRSFLNFIKTPDYLPSSKKAISKKIFILIKFYLISILCLWVARGLNTTFINLNLYDSYNYTIVKSQSLLDSNIYSSLVLIILIFTPILEEIAFRLFLKEFYLRYFLISASLLIGSFIYLCFKNILWYPNASYFNIFIPFFYLIIFSAPVVFLLKLLIKKIKVNKLENYWNSKFPILFYGCSVVFSLYHLPTLGLNLSHYLFLPIILMPFFIYAVILGFVRIRLGIGYSIILHYIFLVPSFVLYL